MVAERARLASFIHDINLLAALEIRLVLVHGARPQIEAELQGARPEVAIPPGPARHRRARRSPWSSTPAARCAWRSRRCCRRGCRTRRWRAPASAWSRATSSPRGRSACARASTSSSPARCARSTPPRSPRSSTSRDIVLVPFVGYSPTGEVFNLAWEDVAESVAVALKADKLLMYTDKLPTNRKGEVVSELTADEALALAGKKTNRTPSTAQALEHAGARACDNGVQRGHLVTRRSPTARCCSSSSPTPASAPWSPHDPVEKLRPAKIEDVRGILELIEPLEAEGTLVKRSRELLEARDRQLLRARARRPIVGCAALYPYPDDKSAGARLPRGGARTTATPGTASGCCGDARSARRACKLQPPLRAHHARRALVPRAGLPRRRRRRAARAAPGALQLAPRLEGVPEADIISSWQEW